MNPAFWKNKDVLLTGHTGFKGSWLSLWLQELGANVSGYSIDVPTRPSLFDTADVGDGMNSEEGDVRDLASLRAFVDQTGPEVVIHMAAQSLVRRSYVEPVGTYDTNVMGAVNILEAVRSATTVRAVIVVTSDKCYQNDERKQGFREHDPMGGYDPYSSSKGCAELVTAAYRNSFFKRQNHERHGTAVASARAGNVIGGGDWAEDRLVPDAVAALNRGETPAIRNPNAVRPWQFVMEPLHGYLILAENLCENGQAFAGAWNFGPDEVDTQEVGFVVEKLALGWNQPGSWRRRDIDQPHEATYLELDSSKARVELGWTPTLDLSTTISWIVEWYQRYFSENNGRAVTLEQIRRYQERAAN